VNNPENEPKEESSFYISLNTDNELVPEKLINITSFLVLSSNQDILDLLEEEYSAKDKMIYSLRKENSDVDSILTLCETITANGGEEGFTVQYSVSYLRAWVQAHRPTVFEGDKPTGPYTVNLELHGTSMRDILDKLSNPIIDLGVEVMITNTESCKTATWYEGHIYGELE